VTQDDVLFTHLTVKETLTYAALLRLPRTMTREQKKERAMDIIYELGLERYTTYSLIYACRLFSQGSLVNHVSIFEGARTQ
jgi:ABC-type multidrug transport system ATPase subunit